MALSVFGTDQLVVWHLALSIFGTDQLVVFGKYTWNLTSTETVRLSIVRRDGEKGVSGYGGGGRGRLLYLSLHCHHQNDSCIKMGSDESHFNVSLIVRDKVTK